jgi:hypothetical protein
MLVTLSICDLDAISPEAEDPQLASQKLANVYPRSLLLQVMQKPHTSTEAKTGLFRCGLVRLPGGERAENTAVVLYMQAGCLHMSRRLDSISGVRRRK